MHLVDIVAALVIGFSVLFGLWRGLTRELVSMVAWIVIGALAYRYAGWLGHLLPFEGPQLVHVAAGAVIIVVAGVVAAAIIGRLMRTAVHASNLAGADRVLGALFGAVRGALVIVVLAALVVEFGMSDQPAWRASTSGPYLEQVWHWMAGSMPPRRAPLVSWWEG